RPSAENGRTSGVASNGATISVTASASSNRTRRGRNCAPNTGATMKQAPMRTKGQKYCASHASSCPLLTAIMVDDRAASSDEARNALEQLARVADEHLEHPGSSDDDRQRHADELRNERERHFVDLRGGLEHADQQADEQSRKEQRQGEQ